MVVVHMYNEESTYAYELNGGLDPKTYQAEVVDGRLKVWADTPVKLR